MADLKHMMRGTAAADPEAWMGLWTGWPRNLAEQLRDAVAAGADFHQQVKWGNLLFVSNGPCVLIHVEDHRVLLGFLRGKRLVGIEPAIKPSGKYELGNLQFGPESTFDPETITRLAARAAALNAELGDPTDLGKRTRSAP